MAKSKELADFRAKHFEELERTIDVFRQIRDDPKASHKDRIEAGKSIGRMLSAMSPAKAGETKQASQPASQAKPTDEEWAEIERRLSA